MEVRNGKKMNFKRIYSQIAKYGRSIPELAEEYGMDEQAFIERMEMGLDPKLFSRALKTNERNLKQQRNNNGNGSEQSAPITTTKTIDENHEEEEDMARRNEERMEQNYIQNQSNKGKAAQRQRKQASRKSVSASEDMSVLENKKVTITGEISDKEKDLNEATQILAIREETVTETQRVFDKARKALDKAKSERDKAKNVVAQHKQSIDKLKAMLGDVETQITELKNKAIYLVAPGYTGKKPAFGTYYSTTEVQGYDTLSVVEAAVDYAIEPELKDMVVAGYDSYKEYMEGLRFVMLCVEYTYKDIEYTVLVNDERLKRLLQTHVG